MKKVFFLKPVILTSKSIFLRLVAPVLLSFVLSVQGCKTENDLSLEDFSVKSSNRTADSDTENPLIQPQWKDAYYKKFDFGTAIVVPVKYNKKRIPVVQTETNTLILSRSTDNTLSEDELNSIILYRDKKGIVHKEIIQYVPEQTWVASLNSGKSKGTFSGLVKVTDWANNYIAGYYYKEGKLLSKVTTQKKGGSSTTRGTYCFDEIWYVTVCSTYEGATHCDTHYSHTNTYCYWIDGDMIDPGYGYYVPPTNGGSGSSGSATPVFNINAIKTVESKLSQNKFFLVDCPDQVLPWRPLAQTTAPQSVMDRLNDPSIISWIGTAANSLRAPGPYIQDILNAKGTIVNCDFFPVTVNTLPPGMTAAQLLNHIRLNLTTFTETTFKPLEIPGEIDRWQNNPLGALISIGITGDPGTVAIIQYSNDRWVFATIHDAVNGDHPVSGNREFGYIANSNGSYTFFTRGVDRVTGDFGAFMAEASRFLLGESIQFLAADRLWTGFQNNIARFVSQRGGNAQVNTPDIKRIDWNKAANMLKGTVPIKQPCK